MRVRSILIVGLIVCSAAHAGAQEAVRTADITVRGLTAADYPRVRKLADNIFFAHPFSAPRIKQPTEPVADKRVLTMGGTEIDDGELKSSQAAGGDDRQPTIALPPPLARVLTDYEAAWRARDAAALARLFADDGVVVPNACPPVKGRARVQECYANSGGPLSLRAIASKTDGAVGYIVGAYADKEGGPDLGKFTLTLAKGRDGLWLIVADMDRPYPRR